MPLSPDADIKGGRKELGVIRATEEEIQAQEARVHFTMTEVNIKVEPGMDLGLAILGWSPTPSHGKRDGDRLQNERGQAGGCSIDKQPAHPDSGASSEDGNSCDKVV